MTPEERHAIRLAVSARLRELLPASDCGDAASESRYVQGCRCRSCTTAQNRAREARRLPERVKTHGYGGYSSGCRCETCRAAQRAYGLARRAHRKATA